MLSICPDKRATSDQPIAEGTRRAG